jgi:fatty acid desaturase
MKMSDRTHAMTPLGFGPFRNSPWDAVLVAATLIHLVLVVALLLLANAPSWPTTGTAIALIAYGLCWNANTISHNHLHNPFFRRRALNLAFDLLLTLLLGVPQSIWKQRHLAHHAGRSPDPPWRTLTGKDWIELATIGITWSVVASVWPVAFFTAFLPGYGLGLLLCQVQGYYEHHHRTGACEEGVSHYGRLYNWVWFNDGYHAEHHRSPRLHWRSLPQHRSATGSLAPQSNARSPLWRWLGDVARTLNRWQGRTLNTLEGLVLGSPWLQRWVLAKHRQALHRLLQQLARPMHQIAIIGGGMFPRSVLALRQLCPRATLTVIDTSSASIDDARSYLRRHQIGTSQVRFICAAYDPVEHRGFDLILVPLAFQGDRQLFYQPSTESNSIIAVHDWAWRRRELPGCLVSLLLCKRLNLVVPKPGVTPDGCEAAAGSCLADSTGLRRLAC